jgi:hypothetical protein
MFLRTDNCKSKFIHKVKNKLIISVLNSLSQNILCVRILLRKLKIKLIYYYIFFHMFYMAVKYVLLL